MAQHFDRVWTFDTARFSVALECAPEMDPDLSWDETGEVVEKLESGEWENFTFRVVVRCDGTEIAANYLGNSIYAHAAEFRDHFGMNAKGHGSYFSDMVRESISDTRKALANMPQLRAA